MIERHKAEQRDRLAALCSAAGAREPQLLADTLTLLLEGARQSPGHGRCRLLRSFRQGLPRGDRFFRLIASFGGTFTASMPFSHDRGDVEAGR